MGTQNAIELLQAVLSDLRAVAEDREGTVDPAAIGRMADVVEMAIAEVSD